jgi:hypothetical protein
MAKAMLAVYFGWNNQARNLQLASFYCLSPFLSNLKSTGNYIVHLKIV